MHAAVTETRNAHEDVAFSDLLQAKVVGSPRAGAEPFHVDHVPAVEALESVDDFLAILSELARRRAKEHSADLCHDQQQ